MANPQLKLSALGTDPYGQTWVDSIVYDPNTASLEHPGWLDRAQWRSNERTFVWPNNSSPMRHMANATEDYFAFEFQVASGEQLVVVGASGWDVNGKTLVVEPHQAVLLSCSTGAPVVDVVAIPKELK